MICGYLSRAFPLRLSVMWGWLQLAFPHFLLAPGLGVQEQHATARHFFPLQFAETEVFIIQQVMVISRHLSHSLEDNFTCGGFGGGGWVLVTDRSSKLDFQHSTAFYPSFFFYRLFYFSFPDLILTKIRITTNLETYLLGSWIFTKI